MKTGALSVLLILAWAHAAWAQDAGSTGGACYGNGTCNAGLTCQSGVCATAATGSAGGVCYGNGTCDSGLTCDGVTNVCQTREAPSPSTSTSPTPPPTPAPAGAPAPAPGTGLGGSAAASEASPVFTPDKTWWVTAKAGFLLGGSVYLEAADQTVDSDSGLALHANIDAAVAPKLAVGGFFFFAKTGLEGVVDANIMTVGGAIKGRFKTGNVELRPGVELGYQIIGGEAFEGTDNSTGFDAGATLEIAVPLNPQSDFVGEIGFISQPAGGNDATSITFAPIFFITGGASFGG